MINLWRRKQELNSRLAQKRGDQNLHRQLAALNKEIEEYALTLTKQNWSSICNQMDHKMGSARTWHLLQHLLNPDNSKLEARQQLQKPVYKYEAATDELITKVRDRYLSCRVWVPARVFGFLGFRDTGS
ncbi:hypothetical protein HPB49_010610 [Dermacentor silvarum]|uniref:Uncharacterized protein n=1 Tax=Dermacentor silvarum TaxID=543639 RepID=A0ACB8CR23_DERSI|nr:hypothetical protein HPB49_010610 [Dermacentor silvarum]